MIWKLVFGYVVASSLIGKRHPNFRFPAWLRMDVLRIYWNMRDIAEYQKGERHLHAESRVGMRGCTFR